MRIQSACPASCAPCHFLCLFSLAFISGCCLISSAHAQVSTLTFNRNLESWEQVMAQTFPDRFDEEMLFSDLQEQLTELGLPLLLSQSAELDELTADTEVSLPLPDQPLRVRLLMGLAKYNATLAYRGDVFSVISRYDVEDPAFYSFYIHDFSHLPINGFQLLNVIQQTVAPDSWQDTGQGLGTITYVPMGRRKVLVIANTYQVQLEIRQLLQGLTNVNGGLSANPVIRGGMSVAQPPASSAASGRGRIIRSPRAIRSRG